MFQFRKRPRFGIALGGGGARGLAHIGVLKVLEREGIRPDVLAGTSMGGIIALAYANGATAVDLEEEALRMSKLRKLVRLVDGFPPRRGLVEGLRLRQYLIEDIGLNTTFDDLQIPCAVCAVDLQEARSVTLNQGSVIDAALATSAVPGLFPPIQVEGRRMVDGGLLNNVPVNLLQSYDAKFTLAVDVSVDIHSGGEQTNNEHLPFIPQFTFDAISAISIMSTTITQYRLKETPPDVLIRPPIPSAIGILTGFTHAEEVIQYGQQAAEQALPMLERSLH